MLWSKDFSNLELIFCCAFAVLYLLFLMRSIYIARQLKAPFGNIFIKLILRSIIFALIIIAILGPSFGDSKKEVKAIGKDIMICIDLSASMNATDIQPSRLERIKFELKNIVEAFSTDRIGIIIFSNEAFMQCPLTYDQNALNLFLETLHTNLVPSAGTDFGPPLTMSLEKIIDEEELVSKPKSKVIILISDGEDFGENTKKIAKEIKEKEIKLFTLGIGTTTGAKIRTRRGFKTDRTGKEVVSKLEPKSLKNLAKTTGGVYYEISESENDISRLINKINSIEGELKDTRQVDTSANRYYYVLLIALFLISIELLLNFKAIKI